MTSCDFSNNSYTAPTYAVAISNDDMSCQITFPAAEIDEDGTVVGIVKADDTLNVLEGWMGDFGTASVYIPCENGTMGICYAEEGTTITKFTATLDDIAAEDLSGVEIAGTAVASGSRTGNTGRADYSFDVTLP